MSKSRFPWLLGGILVVAWAGWHALGLALACGVLAAVYLGSVRLSPRTRHARCNGTGQKQGVLFTWVHRRCGGCNSGRVIRWGARMWGTGPVRAEAARTRRARDRARQTRAWR
jgi:hypothetical protein